ncbi:MAG: imidazole glycerol phosphate synthase, catalytic subunit with HisH [Candidatus Thorarchaeota archaeon]|nr:MAG: imidazole glycerol phosphate synthase, catalytic subunit with HisH [Candidatus Thorarchaeota archaeon]
MTLAKRIIPCLDVDQGRVVKGINFVDLQYAGDPVELGLRYSREGADELVYLDITASSDYRDTILETVSKVASHLDIPFTVGGGVRTVEDARSLLQAGADKVTINTAAVERPVLIQEISQAFGSQCVVLAIDAKKRLNARSEKENSIFAEVYTHGGRTPTGLDALDWAKQGEILGAGEILLTSMDCDGTKNGFDIDLTCQVSSTVRVPVIASGGAGSPADFLEVFDYGLADAALAASVFHYNQYPISSVKQFLFHKGVEVRV